MNRLTHCWASELEGCNRPSKEHIISDVVISKLEIENEIGVFGAPWNEKEDIKIGKGAFTSKILCRRHNNMLSDLDKEAGKLSEILNDIFLLFVDKKLWDKSKTEKLSGSLIERWFLKTSINRLQWHYPHLEPPSKELVEIVFGLKTYPKGTGLTLIQHPTNKFLGSENLSGIIDVDILNNLNQPELVAFSLWGWLFMIPLTDSPVPTNMSKMKMKNLDRPGYVYLMQAVKNGKRRLHPNGISVKMPNGSQRKVIFEW